MDSILQFNGCCCKNLRQLDCAGADVVYAIEDKTAGCSVDQVDHVVQRAAKLVHVFAIKRRYESLIQLDEDFVRHLIAAVLDLLDLLDRGRHLLVVVVAQQVV